MREKSAAFKVCEDKGPEMLFRVFKRYGKKYVSHPGLLV